MYIRTSYCKYYVSFLCNNYVKSNVDYMHINLTKYLTKESRIVPTQIITLWKLQKFTVTEKKISSNQLFSNFSSKNVIVTKFLTKKSDSIFPEFPHCDNYAHTLF